MALCQEVEKISVKNCSDTVSIEEPASLSPISCLSQAVTRLNNSQNPHKKNNLRKPTTVIAGRKASIAGDIRVTSDLSNGCQSITDLPSALVSEILHCLDPNELGIVCCVSTILHNLANDHYRWKEFYCERWGPPLAIAATPGLVIPVHKSWKDLFVEREQRSKSYMGRFSIDALRGHTEAVRAVCLLQSEKLVFTGGYDSIVRIWDMEEGFAIAASQPLGCTVRAIAVDAKLFGGWGTDAFIQFWNAIDGNPHLFDITGSMSHGLECRLWGHHGPITCLALDSTRIYSGSWDMSVRIWDRIKFKCIETLKHRDWVWDLVPRGSTIASSAGSGVYIWDISNGNLLDFIHNAHDGNTYALARSYIGDLLFTGGENGDIHMYKITSGCGEIDIKPCGYWKPHGNSVHSLAFEFPWLVSCSSDGRLALINVRKILKSNQNFVVLNRQQPFVHPQVLSLRKGCFMVLGMDCFLWLLVLIGLYGGEEGVVRIWNFSQALEIEERIHALRRIRLEQRMRRRRKQIEMNGKGVISDQISVVLRRAQRNGFLHGKRRDQKS
ncbi:hypothetical protein HPP92_021206 [Vanilla planifolia]|uniref:F-box domain-containing protein n=1 Tax=Vanilla planifolia TaxID=51239 RepID=A0A835PW69_VANPL|nr:hypothetical protein HPP92_021206 [Vanilla planifolia]